MTLRSIIRKFAINDLCPNVFSRGECRVFDLIEDYSVNDIIVLIVALLFIVISVGLYVVVAAMAKKRNRNVIAWVILSIFLSPLLTIIILLVVGMDDDLK